MWIVLFASVILFIVFGAPTGTMSGYELDNCIMGCASVIDRDKSPTEYSLCVEDCKRRYPQTDL
jgi:hypothetical protein